MIAIYTKFKNGIFVKINMSDVCRYFLRGSCRFGDNCRFSHSGYDSNDGYEYDDSSQQYYGLQSESYSYDKERYSLYDQYSYDRRYNEDHRSSNFDKSYSQSNDRYDNYNQGYDSSAKASDFKYGQNRFRWLSPDYNRQSNHEETHNGYQKQRNSKPSLLCPPKEKVSFSFNSAISEIKSNPSKESNFRTSNEIRKLSEMVAEETRVWEKGKQWPFTCFCPFPEKSNLPSFVDLSPEELQFHAYKAKANGTYSAYVNSVDAALIEVVKNRAQYRMQDSEKLAIIERIQNGEQFKPSVSSVFGNLMGCESSCTSEPMHHEIMPASSAKSSASTFRFVLPDDETIKTTSTSEYDSTYTLIDKLSLKEREQFESSTFTLGKIPTKPPPSVLCF